MKIGLERIDIQEGVTMEALLDSGAMRLVMSSKFARKQFKLKKIERLIYVRNVDSFFNKEGSIEYMMEVNIYYQEHRERTEINVIGRQKWNVILRMLQLAYYNSEIDWRIGEVKKVSRGVLKAVETEVGKVRMAETKEGREKEGRK